MKQLFILIIGLFVTSSALFGQNDKNLEVIAELDFRPGNVAVSKEGRVFTTMHPLGASKVQLIEITGKNSFKDFPNSTYQKGNSPATNDKLDTPLGIRIDNNDVLWIIDMGQNLGKTRVFGFDIASRKEVFRFDFPVSVAPKGSFIQDLAVDEINGWIYFADIANPGIIALDINTKTARRFFHPSVEAEKVDMVIGGELIHFGGAPASVAVNPITLSADRNTLYYGAMNGTTWYKVPANLFRDAKTDTTIAEAIKVAGPKPVSDGVATDQSGNHYFTNIMHNGIDMLTNEGELKPIVRSKKINWPDNVALDSENNIYITVNQLHKSPAFTGGKDQGKAPYFIYRINK